MSPPPPAAESVQELFLKSFEQLAQSDDSPALETLRKAHPESVWTKKANALAELYRSLRRAERGRAKAQSDLRACRSAQKRRQEQIDRLKNDLQKMKDLVIEMELRSK